MSTITADSRVTEVVRTRSNLLRKLLEWGGFGAGAAGSGRRDRQPAVRPDRHGDQAAGCKRSPQPLGDRDRADDRAEHVLHCRLPGTVRNRRRYRALAQRDRLHRSGLRGTPPPEDRRVAELTRRKTGRRPVVSRTGAGPPSPRTGPASAGAVLSCFAWSFIEDRIAIRSWRGCRPTPGVGN